MNLRCFFALNNIRDSKSCTIEDIDRILGIGRAHVIDAIKNLQSAQCIDIIQNRSDKGNWYNVYAQKHTDKYDDKTYNDKKIEVDTPNKKKADEVDNQSVEEGITIKLMA